jgi:hypothetical protein
VSIDLNKSEDAKDLEVYPVAFLNSQNRCVVSGSVEYEGTPLCAMVLANGQYTFTCSGDGKFNLDVPLDGNGEVTLYVFCSGFQPYKYVFDNFPIFDDTDGDGYTIAQGDCNDNNSSVYPGATEIAGDGVDQDCNGRDLVVNPDNDGDGYTVSQGDCDDNNRGIHPGATEIADDGIDQDCDGFDLMVEQDVDGDGYTIDQGDCNDNHSNIYPGATEIANDDIDQDCDGIDLIVDPDQDGDGYSVGQGDCDDSDSSIYPGAPEIYEDGIDQDCNGKDDTSVAP